MKVVTVLRDKYTKEPIPYAPVWIGEELSVSDERGLVTTDVPEGLQRIKVRAPEYEALDRDIEITRPIKLTVSLRSEVL